jgi:hypothetical protein
MESARVVLEMGGSVKGHLLLILLHAPSCLLCPDTAEVGTEATETKNLSFHSFLLCLCEITVEQPSTPLLKDVPMRRDCFAGV